MTPNEIAYSIAVISKHLGMAPGDIARKLFGVTAETLGNWRRGKVSPSRATKAVLRLLTQSIETGKHNETAAILAALGATHE